MKYYKVLSPVFALFLTASNYADITAHADKVTDVLFQNSMSSGIITCYMIFAIFSCAYSYRMTTRPGMSAAVRHAFILRHILYVLVYICAWLPYLGKTIYTTYTCQWIVNQGFKNVTEESYDFLNSHIQKWDYLSNASNVFAGVCLSMIRISEPCMFAVVYSYLRCRKSE